MILRYLLVLGALWGASGTILQAYYWNRMPFSATLMFWLIGGSIIAAVNRWWVFAGWDDELRLQIAAGCLLGAWIVTIYVVVTYVIRPRLSEECFADE